MNLKLNQRLIILFIEIQFYKILIIAIVWLFIQEMIVKYINK